MAIPFHPYDGEHTNADDYPDTLAKQRVREALAAAK